MSVSVIQCHHESIFAEGKLVKGSISLSSAIYSIQNCVAGGGKPMIMYQGPKLGLYLRWRVQGKIYYREAPNCGGNSCYPIFPSITQISKWSLSPTPQNWGTLGGETEIMLTSKYNFKAKFQLPTLSRSTLI